MNVTLSPELEQIVTGKVASGQYPPANEVLGEALRLLAARDEARAARLADLRQELQIGLDPLARGQATAYIFPAEPPA